jgi:hypothetical protein
MPWFASGFCLCLIVLAGSAAATELDRQREQERLRQDQRVAYEQDFAELARLEPERIRDAGGAVRRSGGELALALADRRWTYFHDETSDCLVGVIPARGDGCVAFTFLGRPVPRFYLLRAHYYEGSDWRLVDAGTGRTTLVFAEPRFAPDGRHFVAASAAEIYDAPGIELWSVAADRPALDWKHEPKQYALYSFVGWDGNDAVLLAVRTFVARELRRLPARLSLIGGRWVLEGPAEASRY